MNYFHFVFRLWIRILCSLFVCFLFFLLRGLKISEKECIKVEPSTVVVAIRIWVESSHIMKLLESLLLSGRYENEFSWNYRKSVVPEINQYISIHCKWGQNLKFANLFAEKHERNDKVVTEYPFRNFRKHSRNNLCEVYAGPG